MNRVRVPFATLLTAVILTGQLSLASVFADEQTPATIAGRTIDQYAAALNDDDRVVRLRAIKSLGAFGPPATEAIRKGLEHGDPAVQYTAAVHLGRLGGESLKKATERLTELAQDESSHAVQMASSYALCELGQLDRHLPLLIDSLQYPERAMACSAAELIGRLGPDASGAIEPLEAAYAKHRPGAKGGDYHIGGAAMNALRKIRPSESSTFD